MKKFEYQIKVRLRIWIWTTFGIMVGDKRLMRGSNLEGPLQFCT